MEQLTGNHILKNVYLQNVYSSLWDKVLKT